jgi:hypothetical protein
MFLFLLALTSAVAFSHHGWGTLLNNFAVERAGVDGFGIGLTQSVREVPGFLALLVVVPLLFVREHRLAAIMVGVLGAGVVMTGFLPSLTGLLVATFVSSLGFHYFEPLKDSLALQHFSRAQAPVVLGRLTAASSFMAVLVAGGFALTSGHADYTTLYVVCGGLAVVVGLACAFVDPTSRPVEVQNKGMVLRRRYWLYYVLTLLSGARRQIFVAFAIFLMVERLGFTLREVSIMIAVNHVLTMIVGPMVGPAINRFGERWVLTAEYASLMVVFTVYAFVDSKLLAAGVYFIDSIVFSFHIAIATFFQKIGDRADIAPTMAVGFTINHIAAVVIPVLGGLAWLVDHRIVFLAGVGMAACSLVMVQFITRELARSGTRVSK